mmetsp:Transcript_57083/g.157962  ORF Transcript_57083/g.157962 Transcript_57083/m.157962 type:complete len:212 (+) Transcript_57083:221-856(+)
MQASSAASNNCVLRWRSRAARGVPRSPKSNLRHQWPLPRPGSAETTWSSSASSSPPRSPPPMSTSRASPPPPRLKSSGLASLLARPPAVHEASHSTILRKTPTIPRRLVGAASDDGRPPRRIPAHTCSPSVKMRKSSATRGRKSSTSTSPAPERPPSDDEEDAPESMPASSPLAGARRAWMSLRTATGGWQSRNACEEHPRNDLTLSRSNL